MSPTRRAPARRSLLHQQQQQPSLPSRCLPRGEHQHDDHYCISSSIDHRYQADVPHEESTSTTITTASAAALTIATQADVPPRGEHQLTITTASAAAATISSSRCPVTRRAPARRALLHQQQQPLLPSRCPPKRRAPAYNHYCIISSSNHRYRANVYPRGEHQLTITTACCSYCEAGYRYCCEACY